MCDTFTLTHSKYIASSYYVDVVEETANIYLCIDPEYKYPNGCLWGGFSMRFMDKNELSICRKRDAHVKGISHVWEINQSLQSPLIEVYLCIQFTCAKSIRETLVAF